MQPRNSCVVRGMIAEGLPEVQAVLRATVARALTTLRVQPQRRMCGAAMPRAAVMIGLHACVGSVRSWMLRLAAPGAQ